MNQALLDPSAYSEELVQKYTSVKQELEQAMKDWEGSEQELEKLLV